MDQWRSLWHSTGVYQLELPQAAMILICLLLLYLAIRKRFEPLLLVADRIRRAAGQYSGC